MVLRCARFARGSSAIIFGCKKKNLQRLRILSLLFIGKESILFVVLEHFQDLQNYIVPLDTIMRMRRWLSEKLTLIPNAKLVIVSGLERWKAEQLTRETFDIYYNFIGRELTMATLLELLNKRWQTLDLVSVMQELQRTLIIKKTPQYKLIEGKSVRFSLSKDVDIFDNLSCLPRLQKKELITKIVDLQTMREDPKNLRPSSLY